MRFVKSPASGFTLIELLIVVAIIAILAAIAVPNFLEAQVRAKVTRAQSDHRAMSVGLESYLVDNNTYPIPVVGTGGINMNRLTTPVAYMSQAQIRDVFAWPPDTSMSGQNFFAYGCWIDGICRYVSDSGSPDYSWRKINAYIVWSIGPDRQGDTGGYRGLRYVEDNEGCRVPGSCGTSAGWLNNSNYGGMRYDPTNGTMSKGDIYRFSGLAEAEPSRYR